MIKTSHKTKILCLVAALAICVTLVVGATACDAIFSTAAYAESGTSGGYACRVLGDNEIAGGQGSSGGDHVHVWGRPLWQWSIGYTKAVATFTCTVCGEQHSEETQSISNQTLEDRVVHIATVHFLGKAYSSRTEDLLPEQQQPGTSGGVTGNAEVDLGGAIGLMAVQIVLFVWAAMAISRRRKLNN